MGKEGGDARARAELDRVCLNWRKSSETVYYSEDKEVELKKRKNSIRKIFAEEKLKSSSISNLVALRLLLSFFPKSRKQFVSDSIKSQIAETTMTDKNISSRIHSQEIEREKSRPAKERKPFSQNPNTSQPFSRVAESKEVYV